MTKRHYGKVPARPTDRVGYHVVLSWSPEENVAPETALDIAKEFCRQYLSEYELVYGVHLDTDHRHAHIVFNSVNYKTGKMYRYEKGEWERTLQPLLDKLCAERGLHTLEMDTGVSVHDYPKYGMKKKKRTSGSRKGNWSYENGKAQEYNCSQYLRQLIDQMVLLSSSYEAFEKGMEEAGYQLKYGKSEKYGEYLSIRGEGMRRFRRTHKLGRDYALPMIKARIAAYHEKLPEYVTEERINFIIPVPVFRIRGFSRIQNDYIRKQYTHLYQLGVIPKGGNHLSYSETKQRLKELRQLEKALELINEQECLGKTKLHEAIASQEDKLKNLQIELEELRREKRPYQQMLNLYGKMEKLEGAYLLYQEGDMSYKREADSYRELKKQADTVPHKKEELEQYMRQQKEKVRQVKKALKEGQEKIDLYKGLEQDYDRVIEEYQPADEEMLQQMEAASEKDRERKGYRR